MKSKDSIIHPTADVSQSAKLGKNVKIWHQSQVREGVVIGDNCIIGKGVYIDHDVQIGSNVKIQNYANIYYNSIIEDGVFIGPFVCLTNDKYPKSIDDEGRLIKENKWSPGIIRIKKGAALGAGVIVITGITIGENSFVGAGSVVTKDVANGAWVSGVPARVYKEK